MDVANPQQFRQGHPRAGIGEVSGCHGVDSCAIHRGFRGVPWGSAGGSASFWRGSAGVPWGSVGSVGVFRGGSVVAPSIELNVSYHVSGDIDGGSAFQKAISAEPPFATCNFLLKLKKGK